MNKINTAVILSLSLFILCCETDQYVSEYDDNNDEVLNREEFNHAITDQEYFISWDLDEDNRLNQEEWTEGFKTYSSEAAEKEVFEDWDINKDNYVDEQEYNERSFELWDENKDEGITIDEYTAWNEDIKP